MRFKIKREKPINGNEIVFEERDWREIGSDWDERKE
jgi:hypothetical protein